MGAWIQARLVVRTTLAVLSVAVLVGLLADLVTGGLAARYAQERQRQALEAILDVVGPSASAACFAGDRTLASQVVQGLVGTRSVHTATLRDESGVLGSASRGGTLSGTPPLRRPLASPFAPGARIGELTLVPDPDESARLVRQATKGLRILLSLLTLVMGLGIALVVHRFITQPIRLLSDRLHGLEAATGERLFLPRGHEEDEIGTLVRDVNALVERLVEAMLQERTLGEQAAKHRQKLQAILNIAGTGLLVVDASGRLEDWNPSALRLLRIGEMPTPTHLALPVLFGLEVGRVEVLLERCLRDGTHQEETLLLDSLCGDPPRWVQLSLDPIGTTGVLGLIDDVTEHLRAKEDAQVLALQDPLTGALNRLGAERLISDRLQAAHPGLAVMLVDLDHFKAINDTHGHAAGDRVLCHATEGMRRGLRRTDHVARLGGDEFLLVIEGLVDRDIALALARKVIDAVVEPLALPGGGTMSVGASIGIALVPPGEEWAVEEVVRRADRAMYQVKEAGRNDARIAD